VKLSKGRTHVEQPDTRRDYGDVHVARLNANLRPARGVATARFQGTECVLVFESEQQYRSFLRLGILQGHVISMAHQKYLKARGKRAKTTT